MNKLLVLAAGLAFAGAASATTRPDQSAPGIVVRYGDLNLDSPAGVAALHARLRRAAKNVCNTLDNRVLGLHEQFDLCVADATTRGVRDVNNANLSKFHRWGTRRSKADPARS